VSTLHCIAPGTSSRCVQGLFCAVFASLLLMLCMPLPAVLAGVYVYLYCDTCQHAWLQEKKACCICVGVTQWCRLLMLPML
jgi:hypothetical protein